MVAIERCSLVLFLATVALGGCKRPHRELPEETLNVLVYSETAWYRHPEISRLNGWMAQLGYRNGIRVDVSGTAKDFRPKWLEKYQVIIFNSPTNIGESLDEEQREALVYWFRAGGGFVGLHGSAVHHDTWDWYSKLYGCDFDSDSEYVTARVLVDPGAKDHPAVKGYFPEFQYTADWHTFTRSVTGDPGVQVLLRVDESSFEVVRKYFRDRGKKPMDGEHPVAWTREFEGGRLFYTCLGHDVRSLDTEFGRQHLLGGIRWAAGK